MGKAGKSRKRLRTNNERGSLSDDENETNFDKSHSAIVACQVFYALRQNLNLYLDKRFKILRVALFPLIQCQLNKYFELDEESPLESDDINDVLTEENVAITLQSINFFVSNLHEFNTPDNKLFRKAMHLFVLLYAFSSKKSNLDLNGSNLVQAFQKCIIDSSFSNRISSHLRCGQWKLALKLLNEMFDSDEIPKLGSLQRWVRECDVDGYVISKTKTGDPQEESSRSVETVATAIGLKLLERNVYANPLSRQLLYAVMRVMRNRYAPTNSTGNAVGSSLCSMEVDATINCHYNDIFVVGSNPTVDCIYSPVDARNSLISSQITEVYPVLSSNEGNVLPGQGVLFTHRISIVSHVPGNLRRPPVPHDLNIYMTTANSIVFEETCSKQCFRTDIPNIHGAFVLSNVLSRSECCQFIIAAESMKYTPDSVDGIDNVVWLADETILNVINTRVRSLLPAALGKYEVSGINARLRLFRYYPGAVYRPV